MNDTLSIGSGDSALKLNTFQFIGVNDQKNFPWNDKVQTQGIFPLMPPVSCTSSLSLSLSVSLKLNLNNRLSCSRPRKT